MREQPGFFEVVYTTRALRRFRPDPVPDEVLFQLLDAAIRAPSGQNAQDWRFIIVRDRTVKERMQTWALQAWERYAQRFPDIDSLPRTQRLSLRAVEHLASHFAEVPVVIVVCGLRGRHTTPGGSIFPAVQNLLLAARALGLGGSIFNLALGDREALRQLLGIPDTNEIFCALPLGYPSDRHGPVRRKPVKNVTFLERWGRRWPFAEAQPDEGWQGRWLQP
ncbi:5,6-dimethylbenzimidazole synthase [bacterium HR29]|jgi:nitroreductase|nr:5,6-dimethylbenzimidazole synthase [bacterium HR29]